MMNKKRFYIMACGALLACSLSSGLLAEKIEFVRASGDLSSALNSGKAVGRMAMRAAVQPVADGYLPGIQKASAGTTVFAMHPTEAEFSACTVFDGNGDGCKIIYDVHSAMDGEVFDWPICYNNRQTPSATADADEWIITPAVTLTDISRLYNVSIEADATTNVKSESFEIVMAKAGDLNSMRAGRVILNEPSVTTNVYTQCGSRFGVTEPGDYYFGIHITSSLDMGWRLMLRDFKVEITDQPAQIPAACTELTLTPDAAGALKAEVAFTMPVVYVSGSAIPASEALEAKIVTPAESVTVSGRPGAKVTRTVKVADGSNIVTVTVCNANGDGLEAKGVVLCGADRPIDPVVTAAVSEDNMDLLLKWDPVTVGANGGIVPQNSVKYSIYRYVTLDDVSMWKLVEGGLTACEYSCHAESEDQQLYELMVAASNERGSSEGSLQSYASAILGKPHKLPVDETYADGKMKYTGLLIDYPDENYTADWALDATSQLGISGGPAYALMCVTLDVSSVGYGYVEMPKVSTVGCNKPRVRMLTYISDATPETIISIHSTEGRGNGKVLGVIDRNAGSGWVEMTFDIPESYCSKNWIVVSADVRCQTAGQVFVLGEFSVTEGLANDLALTRISAPSYVVLGDEAEFTATVQNRGFNPVAAPTLQAEIRCGQKLVGYVDMIHAPVTLAENDKADYTGSFRMLEADMAGLDYTVAISLPDADDNDGNDYASTTFRVGIGGLPVVTDLKASGAADGNKVALGWTDPLALGTVDNFEAYAHGCYDYNLGDWKNIDGDKEQTYYSSTYAIPDAGAPKAFQAVNAPLSGMNGMNQISGDSFLMAFCPMEATADDWLISPQVVGGSKISFYMTSLSADYPEKVEVMASTTDDEMDSFTALGEVTITSTGWRRYSVDLPAEAKYFAIHYFSTDQFGICIDDIAYSPVEVPFEITGWNVYRDGVLIGKCEAGVTTFTDAVADANATYRYNVAAVGTRKGVEMEFPLSTAATFSASISDVDSAAPCVTVADGVVTIDGCEGHAVEITDIRGVRLYGVGSAPCQVTVPLAPGVYLITVNGVHSKVLVP